MPGFQHKIDFRAGCIRASAWSRSFKIKTISRLRKPMVGKDQHAKLKLGIRHHQSGSGHVDGEIVGDRRVKTEG